MRAEDGVVEQAPTILFSFFTIFSVRMRIVREASGWAVRYGLWSVVDRV